MADERLNELAVTEQDVGAVRTLAQRGKRLQALALNIGVRGGEHAFERQQVLCFDFKVHGTLSGSLHWLDGLLVEVRQFLEDTLVNAPKAPTTVIPSLALDDSVTPVAEDAKVEVHGGLFVVR